MRDIPPLLKRELMHYHLERIQRRGVKLVTIYSDRLQQETKIPQIDVGHEAFAEILASKVTQRLFELLASYFRPINEKEIYERLSGIDKNKIQMSINLLCKAKVTYQVSSKELAKNIKEFSAQIKGLNYYGLAAYSFNSKVTQLTVSDKLIDRQYLIELERPCKKAMAWLVTEKARSISIKDSKLTGWGESEELNDVFSTALTLESLVLAKEKFLMMKSVTSEGYEKFSKTIMEGITWLKYAQNTSKNIDRFLKTDIEEDVEKFKKREVSPDGGWAFRKGQKSEVGLTAIAVKSLIRCGEKPKQDYIQQACSFLEKAQNARETNMPSHISKEGSWESKGSARLAETSAALYALLLGKGRKNKSIQKGIIWLRNVQNSKDRINKFKKEGILQQYETFLRATGKDLDENLPKADNGWGLSLVNKSSPLHTAWALVPLKKVLGKTEEIKKGIEFLVKTQDSDGSWEDRSFTTAVVIQSLLDCSVSARAKVVRNGVKYLLKYQDDKEGFFGKDKKTVFHTPATLTAILKYYQKM